MPELPEVETTLRGLSPYLENCIIQDVIIRKAQLRWPIPLDLSVRINQQTIHSLSQRGKYLLIHLDKNSLIIHLGMSGNLQIVEQSQLPKLHDHVDFLLSSNKILRYQDPRRFGSILLTEQNQNPLEHPLLNSLGLEPLSEQFHGNYLKKVAKKRRVPIKSFIMNSKIVTGVGNIYAAEALFLSRIHPLTEAGRLTQPQCDRLAIAIKDILQAAILQGGTTLKDFVNSEGKPGYFSQKLFVYGRADLPCLLCDTPLLSIKLGQRSTVFCPKCQK